MNHDIQHIQRLADSPRRAGDFGHVVANLLESSKSMVRVGWTRDSICFASRFTSEGDSNIEIEVSSA